MPFLPARIAAFPSKIIHRGPETAYDHARNAADDMRIYGRFAKASLRY